MNSENDEDKIRMAFRVLNKDGSGTINSIAFKHIMTHIGNACILYTSLENTQPILGSQKNLDFLAYSAILTEFVVGQNGKKIKNFFLYLVTHGMERLIPDEHIARSKKQYFTPP